MSPAMFLSAALVVAAPAPIDLRVSDNRRFLVTGDGQPFFWLGDTAWELFHRLTLDEATTYLETRAAQGFTVVQAVALAELDGLGTPTPAGYLPLIGNDPLRPAVVDGPANDYWDHVDAVVAKANELGLVIAMLPTWGAWWHDGDHPALNADNAAGYGEWLAHRYRAAALVWVLGGDRDVENDAQRATIEALSAGLARGDEGKHLITFHPRGARSSAEMFQEATWLDFNMRQNGHTPNSPRYLATRDDYDRQPTKPVLDGEPLYEDHPIDFNAKENGHSIAADVRRCLYWDLFAGAFGHTYGHHSVWQMYADGRNPVNGPLMTWRQALLQPGAAQMVHGRRLLESRPFLSRVPDDSLIVPDAVPTAVPGAGRYRIASTRDQDGSYAMVYAPIGRAFSVNLDALSGDRCVAWWFDPRTGAHHRIGEFDSAGTRRFEPPTPGELLDWVLVLDDEARGYGPPGAASLMDRTG